MLSASTLARLNTDDDEYRPQSVAAPAGEAMSANVPSRTTSIRDDIGLRMGAGYVTPRGDGREFPSARGGRGRRYVATKTSSTPTRSPFCVSGTLETSR